MMNDRTGNSAYVRAAVATLVAAVVLATMAVAVAVPASAQPTDSSTDAREPVLVGPTLGSAQVASGEGLEPAAVSSHFSAGYLISDYAFFNRTAMTEDEIQASLEDSLGPRQNTRCLDILRQSSDSRAVTARCNAYAGGTDELVSRLIYKVQVACGVSAKVMLVTLRKEQGLVISTAPTERTVKYALGFGCPDTAPCDPAVAGIGVQLYYAAAQFQRYRLNPTAYNFRTGTFAIQYHPNSACGTKTAAIRNQATAGLHNHTPYTPNATALANL